MQWFKNVFFKKPLIASTEMSVNTFPVSKLGQRKAVTLQPVFYGAVVKCTFSLDEVKRKDKRKQENVRLDVGLNCIG